MTTEISGFEDFADDLNDFADSLDKIKGEIPKAINEGMGVTAQAMTDEMRDMVPVDDGDLKSTIRVDNPELMEWTIKVGGKNDVDYAYAIEFGSGVHGSGNGEYTITPNGNYPLHFTVDGHEIYTHEVTHPGVPEQPFFRPGYRKHKDELKSNVMNEVEKVFDRHL